MTHYFAWKKDDRLVYGHEPKRTNLYKRHLKIICSSRGKRPNSALVEFDNGQREVISRRAIRRVKHGEIESLDI